jgi:hypothetical protein
VGYVRTDYAQRPLEEVEADEDRWFQFYPEVRGIFLDEQASAAERVDYYVAAAQHARQKQPGLLVVSNPGAVCAREYLTRSAADVICLTERGGALGTHGPAWMEAEPAHRFASLIYGIEKAEQVRPLVRDAIERRVGYLYLTDANQPNPWDRLPRWWADEVAAVREANEGQPGDAGRNP